VEPFESAGGPPPPVGFDLFFFSFFLDTFLFLVIGAASEAVVCLLQPPVRRRAGDSEVGGTARVVRNDDPFPSEKKARHSTYRIPSSLALSYEISWRTSFDPLLLLLLELFVVPAVGDPRPEPVLSSLQLGLGIHFQTRTSGSRRTQFRLAFGHRLGCPNRKIVVQRWGD
jgi:hypothetical protein